MGTFINKNASIKDFLPQGQKIDLLIFTEYVMPEGRLDNSFECHALFYYYVHAMKAYSAIVKENHQVYEGDKDSGVNFQQLFESTALLYSVDPYIMSNYWQLVDNQCDKLGLPKLPDEKRYRFNSILIL